jgi:serine/threonine protein kinase
MTSDSRTSPIPLTQIAHHTVAGRYRLEQKLGQGALGTVFRATDLELGEAIALKIFAHPTHDPEANENFRQELKLTRQLTHPNVIRLFDIGIHQSHRFITMELLVGRDLKSVLSRPLQTAQGLGYLVQACAGLQAAHDLGIVHRDVKPENFFVIESELLKVMDFGIAKQRDTSAIGSKIAGTPEYMAPEQIQQFDSVGPSADLYALGAVAYEIFTGAPPFQHADPQLLLRMQLEALPEPPSARNPDVPGELEEIVLRLLEKAPSRRFASCRQLAAALEPIRQRYAVEELF